MPSSADDGRPPGGRARLGASTLWLGVGLGLACGALAGWATDPGRLDWQPTRALAEPWRMFSAAFVHLSGLHLLANLLATALVAAYGWAAGAGRRVALAWLAAWPLSHLALLAQPQLAHYGGLSGVLHAGVAATSVMLVVEGRGARRTIGALVLGGQLLKVLLERPWGPALQPPGALGVAVAPLAHASGTLAGAACAALALAFGRRRGTP